MRTFLLLVVALSFCIYALDIQPNSLEGTEYNVDGLTQKQLAIQRYFAQITYISRNTPQEWDEWFGLGDCDNNDCVRYQLAAVGYASALMAIRTPAYMNVSISILDDVISRMIDKVSWQYVELFPTYRAQPTYPDPVAYKNIMYSGHLAQLISLYEWITGNFKYSNQGWDFVWDDQTRFHYTTLSLIDIIYEQIINNQFNGIACEPDSIFILCNNFPHNAFRLIDTLHKTNYTQSDNKWLESVSEYGVQRVTVGGQYFMLEYLIRPGIWEPEASQGSDAWALAWMKAWWSMDSRKVITQGYQHLAKTDRWRSDVYGEYIEVEKIGSKFFPFNDAITTSFYPLIEKQYFTNERGIPGRGINTLNWFEGHYGTLIDSNHDNTLDSYYYLTPDNTTIFATANLLTSFLIPNITNPDFIFNLFQTNLPFYETINNLPYIEYIDYPHVMILAAQVNITASILMIQVIAGDNPPINNTLMTIVQLTSIKKITRNGEIFNDYSYSSENLKLNLNVPTPNNQVQLFDVYF